MRYCKSIPGLFTTLCLLFLAATAMAQPPQTVLLQGQLLNSGGAPIPGLRQYQVKFFDAETGGAQLGATLTEFTLVGAEGIFAFSVVIPQEALDAAEAWYELTLDSAALPDGVADANDQFPERVRVHSVPFARVAGKAMNVDVSDVGDGSVTQLELSTLSGVTANIQTQMDSKANAANVYTKSEMDTSQTAQDTEIDKKYEFQWQVVNAGPVQMESNKGYVVDSTSEVMLTLPDSTSLAVGDVVRVSGMGTGGWRVAQNAAQQILTQGLAIPDYTGAWIPHESSSNWNCVTSSADGTKLFSGVGDGIIRYSSDSGSTWKSLYLPMQWRCMAISADGTKLVAAVYNGRIYTSSGSFLAWHPHDINREWKSVASSADGTKLVAAVYNGQIYTSTDSGETWTPRDNNRKWTSVASSEDGTKLVAGVEFGQIYTSTDSGETWIPRDIDRFWYSVASSADGKKLVAGVTSGKIYTSTDSGATWIPHDKDRSWNSVASSVDGTKLVAGVFAGQIYTSVDSGETWSPHENTREWAGVASNADGTKLVAVVLGGQIYTYSAGLSFAGKPTTAGVSGGILGSQHSAIELQYIGNDTFQPLSHEGNLGVQ